MQKSSNNSAGNSGVCPMLIFLFWLMAVNIAVGQFSESDRDLLEQQNFSGDLPVKKKVTLMPIGSNVLSTYNPISLTFSGLLYFYQKVVSEQISANCPFEISCSSFSKACIMEYGFLKGMALSADRLMRCNQIAAYDIHPMLFTEAEKISDPIQNYRVKD